MTKVTTNSVGKILDKIFGSKRFSTRESLSGILDELLTNTENFRTPFTYSNTYAVENSLPVYADSSYKRGSDLVNILMDSPDEVAFVVDSVFKSENSLFFATIRSSDSVVRYLTDEWMYFMKPAKSDVMLKKITNTDMHIIVSRLDSFKQKDL